MAIALWCASLVVAAWALRARADEASGTWTGELEGRGNYYYERSTRVMIPTGRLTLEAPNGVRMHGEYLVDVISTASAAARSDSQDNVFTELRHGIGVGVGKLFTLGDHELDLSFHGIYSTETDYYSWIFGARASYAFNEKNTTLALGVVGVHDIVYRNLGTLGMHDPAFRGVLDGVTTSLSLSQVLSPVLIASLSYQFAYLTGYQGNPYRRALVGPRPLPEAPPEDRQRHNFEGQLQWYVPASSTTFQVFARFYTDSWSLQAITPELRIYQALGRDWTARLRFRYYLQGRASFALPHGQMAYAEGYTGPLTNDHKLRSFHSEQLGLRITYALTGLQGSALGFLSRAVLDVSLDHQWNNNGFNSPNNLIGTLGGRLPF